MTYNVFGWTLNLTRLQLYSTQATRSCLVQLRTQLHLTYAEFQATQYSPWQCKACSEVFLTTSAVPFINWIRYDQERHSKLSNQIHKLRTQAIYAVFLQRVGIAESYSSAVYAMIGSVCLSVRLSVRLSVLRHIPVFCRDEWSYEHAVFTDR